GFGLDRLWWMADFALWGAAYKAALWSSGTFGRRGYEANRKPQSEALSTPTPVAVCVREIMAERSSWTGNAAAGSAASQTPTMLTVLTQMPPSGFTAD